MLPPPIDSPPYHVRERARLTLKWKKNMKRKKMIDFGGIAWNWSETLSENELNEWHKMMWHGICVCGCVHNIDFDIVSISSSRIKITQYNRNKFIIFLCCLSLLRRRFGVVFYEKKSISSKSVNSEKLLSYRLRISALSISDSCPEQKLSVFSIKTTHAYFYSLLNPSRYKVQKS